MAYQSDESGRSEVYVIDFPEVTRKWTVSREGGWSPSWAPDGSELFFRNSGKVMPAPVARAAGGIEIGPPKELGLSEAPLLGILGPDGERFPVG